MEAKAYLKYLRISPRKVKIVLDLIRGKDTTVAAAILKNTPKAASPEIGKLLKSAIANAEPLRFRVLRLPRTDSQETAPQSQGLGRQDPEKNISCDARRRREEC